MLDIGLRARLGKKSSCVSRGSRLDTPKVALYSALPTFPLRLPLLPERPHPLLLVLRGEQEIKGLALLGHPVRQMRFLRAVHRLLAQPHRHRATPPALP